MSKRDNSGTFHIFRSKPHKSGDLQVWWIPQVPMRAFEVDVRNVAEGVKIMNVLTDYDKFQFETGVKPDYSSAGGLRRWCEDNDGEGTPGWEDWYDEETGEDNPAMWLKSQTEFWGVDDGH